MPAGLTPVLFQQIFKKIDRSESKNAFYICMALGRGLGKKIDQSQIPDFSDVIYALYISVARHIKEYDLQQLSQLSIFFAKDEVTKFVPDEFWYEQLEI